MNRATVLLDACVLYPAPLRDLLMHLTLADVFRAKWTEEIHREWMESVLSNRPELKRDALERTRTLMTRAAPDATVVGFEPLIGGLELPDPDDRHVLATAIHSRADLIVTFNLKDFPADRLSPFGVEAQHPDSFLIDQLNLNQPAVLLALKRQRASLRNPPMRSLEFLDSLERQRLPGSVQEFRRFADLI
jgi:predicted nucleic acid-binding protein